MARLAWIEYYVDNGQLDKARELGWEWDEKDAGEARRLLEVGGVSSAASKPSRASPC